MNTPVPSVFIIDDHVVVRNGLAELIDLMGGYKVTGQYSNGQELIDALATLDVLPDLLLLDIHMPVMNGEETLQRLNELGCTIPVIMLTLITNEATVLRLYKAGVRGYLSKECTAVELKEAMNSVLKKGFHQSELLYHALINGHPEPEAKESAQEMILKQMTPRELQFLRLVCHEAEYTYEQIAGDMQVSRRTVDGYRESLFDKFSIKSKTGLVLFAIRHKLV